MSPRFIFALIFISLFEFILFVHAFNSRERSSFDENVKNHVISHDISEEDGNTKKSQDLEESYRYTGFFGCPKPDLFGQPWIYFGTPDLCYSAWERGPCSEHEYLVPKQDLINGFCASACNVREQIAQGFFITDDNSTLYVATSKSGLEQRNETLNISQFHKSFDPCEIVTARLNINNFASTKWPLCHNTELTVSVECVLLITTWKFRNTFRMFTTSCIANQRITSLLNASILQTESHAPWWTRATNRVDQRTFNDSHEQVTFLKNETTGQDNATQEVDTTPVKTCQNDHLQIRNESRADAKNRGYKTNFCNYFLILLLLVPSAAAVAVS